MHITLKFIAKADDNELKAFDDVIGEVARRSMVLLTRRSSEQGVFPDARRARVLWLGVGEGDVAMKTIHTDLEESCRRSRFADRRTYI